MTNRIHHRTGAEAPRSKAALLGSTTLASVAALFVITGPVSAQQTVTLAPVAVGGEAPRELTTTSAITQQDIDREQPLNLRELFRDDR